MFDRILADGVDLGGEEALAGPLCKDFEKGKRVVDSVEVGGDTDPTAEGVSLFLDGGVLMDD